MQPPKDGQNRASSTGMHLLWDLLQRLWTHRARAALIHGQSVERAAKYHSALDKYSWFTGKVSADKCRLRDESFDLDLTYITDRIIAMSFPADGYEKAYRNDIDEVATFLRVSVILRFDLIV